MASVSSVAASNSEKRHSGNFVLETLQSKTFHLTPACTMSSSSRERATAERTCSVGTKLALPPTAILPPTNRGSWILDISDRQPTPSTRGTWTMDSENQRSQVAGGRGFKVTFVSAEINSLREPMPGGPTQPKPCDRLAVAYARRARPTGSHPPQYFVMSHVQ